MLLTNVFNNATLSAATVSTHKYNLLNKHGLKNVVELARYFLQEKL